MGASWALHSPQQPPDQAPRPVCPPNHGQPVLYSQVSCEIPICPTLMCDGVRMGTSSSSSPPWVQHFQEKSNIAKSLEASVAVAVLWGRQEPLTGQCFGLPQCPSVRG